MLIQKIKSNYVEVILLLLLFVISFCLRFPNLGYSDYIGDEHKSFIELKEDQSYWNFFMTQRKGPMQFLVSYIPFYFTGDWHNELAERIPFTLFGLASIFIFYGFIKKVTENRWIAFIASLLLSINGFIIGFSRISQYQNLNLFFSFAALYFYADFLKPHKELLKTTLLGTVSFAISMLSHWDVIFVLVPTIYFFINFLFNKEVTKEIKIKVVLFNLLLGSLLLLPFLIPYVRFQSLDTENKEYFGRRVGFGYSDFERYDFLFNLYNPFLVKEFLLVLAIASLAFIKRSWMYFIWFAINYGIFEFFVRKPGTHIYNFVIPLIILASLGLVLVLEKIPNVLKNIILSFVLVLFVFFIYQSYTIFIDNSVEYPWSQESLFAKACEKKYNAKGELTRCGKLVKYFETPEYNYDEKAPLFGFPLRRNWDEINDYINSKNLENNEDFGYTTNEVKTIAEWYMDAGYKGNGDFYAVGIKKPLSFVDDWKFPQISGKEKVYEIENNGEVVVRIYRVEGFNE